jgi:hypothetical protein
MEFIVFVKQDALELFKEFVIKWISYNFGLKKIRRFWRSENFRPFVKKIIAKHNLKKR